jgi:hypothetical protein
MVKMITGFLLCFNLANAYAQAERNVTLYALTQYNNTLYDRTKGNNPWGGGLGLQALLHTVSKIKPTIELMGDLYLEDDKIYRLNSDGTEIPDVPAMVNLMAGASYHPAQCVYVSIVAGPSFIGGQTAMGIKPSLGFYLSPNKRWMGKASYINIFDRDKTTKKDFGSISLAIGIKLR